MGNAQMQVRLVFDYESVKLEILKALAARLNETAVIAAPNITRRLALAITEAIDSSPEALDLRGGGKLKGELGVVNAETAIEKITSIVIESVEIQADKFKADGSYRGISGKFKMTVLPKDLTAVLSLKEGSFRSENGYEVPWLKWLLTMGDRVIIQEYGFVAGPHVASRTGLGIMVENHATWKVPQEFSGTIANNWLSRALNTVANDMGQIIQEEFQRNF